MWLQLGFWYTWVVLPIFVITAVFWVTRLNKVSFCAFAGSTCRPELPLHAPMLPYMPGVIGRHRACVPGKLQSACRAFFASQGLRMFPAMIIVPIMQIAWTLLSIISGMLYFKEYTSFTPLKAGMFGLGVVVSALGVQAAHARMQAWVCSHSGRMHLRLVDTAGLSALAALASHAVSTHSTRQAGINHCLLRS